MDSSCSSTRKHSRNGFFVWRTTTSWFVLTLVLTAPVGSDGFGVLERRSSSFSGQYSSTTLGVRSAEDPSLSDNVVCNDDEDSSAALRTLLQRARALGPVGSDRTEAERDSLLQQARETVQDMVSSSSSSTAPSRVPLTGIHRLVYSASQGGSSGKVGPWTGFVTQEFVDEVTFFNRVELPFLKIALRAEREILDQQRIRVNFKETVVSVFGFPVVTKDISGTGGVWKCLYAGEMTDVDGQRKLVRVMETPSLFVLEQDLD